MTEDTRRTTSRQQEGAAYGMAPSSWNATITEVGPGTPCGELMRRYWQPVGLSAEVTDDLPKAVRILGEDLVLFRDGQGRAGLVHARCSHRGTSLYYGKIEADGIRCCYHGWLFDVEGRCLDQPCEPDGGLHRDKVRQPWYPVEERYGLVFAYMGPLDRKPALPRYDILENLAPGETLEQDGSNFYIGGGKYDPQRPYAPFNWLQCFENVMDPYHVLILHSRFNSVQFRKEFALMPRIEWEYMDHGVVSRSFRTLEDGRHYTRVNQVVLPNVRIVPSVEMTPGAGTEVGWVVPVDDTHTRTFGVAKVKEPGLYSRRSRRTNHNGKLYSEMTEEEHQRSPDDYEAQWSQGPITLHSDEHLATSDKGIVLLRRLLAREIQAVQEGRDPLGTARQPSQATLDAKAGNFFET